MSNIPLLPQIGAETFGDISQDAEGNLLTHAQVIRNVIAEGQAAEAANLDFFGVGEHHRDDYAVSAPEMILAALASTTQRIKLGTAVTVLSSDDPVRLYQRFATLDAISQGRAEIVAGRGSFVESFPLFGFELDDYEELFDQKLDLLAKLRHGEPVIWHGNHRAALRNQQVYPLLEDQPLTTWVGVGGSPQSVVRAARHGLPLFLAIIGGQPSGFEGLVSLYHRALKEFGHEQQPVAAHFHGLVADSDEEALETLWPHYQRTMNRLGAERGWPPASKMRLQAAMGPEGAMMAGSPQTVAAKLVAVTQKLGLSRADIKYSAGTLPHEAMMHSIKLLGEEVKPRVHQLLTAQK
ncbi:Atu2307/SP_0267 family LLM class monooxygenase [Arthrobacter sp. NIO-1057]|uniref:Atu2307/SP_0267 family LLM class monooxygenase n=1 Tax=Arthrobacter sp. NIO-1057 TaxID=993071 RepID=UPI00071E221B|nr:Atu2307/SP_0267 family LLM class monooxygenase [Arthrobacter sp. NIO-1057]KSU66787.1 luciferase [Arthrobacter sp. NIO-1057]SCC23708.1 probable oxidoreductase, LLM family [Arthrobacter sp. NIO-1057]